jgi:high-affinity iron transporter
MLATLIVVFREVLEASLIVGIVLAATRGLPGRGRWVGAGMAAGALGAGLVAMGADQIAAWVHGYGQELFNATILFAAVFMLGWHNIWMSRHGRQMAREIQDVGAQIREGRRTMAAMAMVCAMAILREGSEVVLFLYSIAVAGGSSTAGMVLGGILGLALGAAFGSALYLGLSRIPARHLFGATSALVVLLAAGLASQGAADLAAADVLPTLGNGLWDSSSLLTERSMIGQVLHVLAGYTARPLGIQVVFYLGTLVVIVALMRWMRTRPIVRA